MSEISPASTSATLPHSALSRRQRLFGQVAAAVAAVILLVRAVSDFLSSAVLSPSLRAVASDVGEWVGELTFLFPLPLHLHIPDVWGLRYPNSTPFEKLLNEFWIAIVLIPLAYLTGVLLCRAGRAYGWRYVIPGYLALSCLAALASAFFFWYSSIGDPYLEDWKQNFFSVFS